MTDIAQQLDPAITGASFEPDVLYQSSEADFVLTVGYTALTPDKAYYVTATLMDPSTGLPWLLAGEPIEETAGLVPEGSDGTVEIPFRLDITEMEGSIVLSPHIEVLQEGGLKVCDTNEGMANISIVSPVLTQTFLASDGTGKITDKGTTSLVQTVTYHGLEPEEEYRIEGELCAGRIQLPIELEDGSHYLASETFVPQAEDGRVVLTYKVDGTQIPGITIVPRWELYKGSSLVAVLTDGSLEPKIAVAGMATSGDEEEENSPSPSPTPTATATPEAEASAEESEVPASEEPSEEELAQMQQAQQNAQTMMIVIVIVVIGGLGAAVHFIFLRKRRR